MQKMDNFKVASSKSKVASAAILKKRIRAIFLLSFKLLPVLLLCLFSCNSPEARLEHLQHDFWEKLARQDFFEIKFKNEVLHLPLPPASDPSAQQKSWAVKLQQEARSIEKEKLSADQQKQLAQLSAALDDCVAHAGNPLFDPARCAVSEQLQAYREHPEFSVLLEKIPAYYAQIEQRWQTPDVRFVPTAVAKAQSALDLLDTHQKKTEKLGQIPAAQAALKDFIGLCQSAVLN
jgi:hypothetical protein